MTSDKMGLYFPSSKNSLNGCCGTVLINKLGLGDDCIVDKGGFVLF